ncbi:uncharacterized protein LOC113308570 [Papaver somniferum]|uniref:uncharacterized protein LOC113308570 n=1 Tax=Papaver somniferum TaxID=3469 RepID=UPI000E6F8D81|nr:uncharacterized protein LOC113308570 [Papaver somniferum]
MGFCRQVGPLTFSYVMQPATHVLIENGWHYLACHRCSKKVMGDDGDLWCTKCEAKVEMPLQGSWSALRRRTHWHHSLCSLDSEVHKLVRSTAAELIGASEDNAKSAVISGFLQILQQAVDFQITINSFNMKHKIPISFTVTRINSPALLGKGVFATVKVEGVTDIVDVMMVY